MAIQDIPSSWWSKSICSPDIMFSDKCSYNPFMNPSLSLTFLGISVFAILLARSSLGKISYPFRIEVKKAKAIPNEIINYTFPYVVSFMGISYSEPQKLLGFAVFLVWMFAITYKSGQILMNPLLLILGWRLYEATIQINNVEKDVRVLKAGMLSPGTSTAQTIQEFYIIKG
ncbi:hypothetical protein [Alishewanella aestuarii]|uniref:hypothetical protein n=1 Tax=Alishewanella aestuarii TaxID=453835 RepID=UPI001EE6742E|nr:hypothetical protein [Alishewanella aestuarii]